MGSGCSALTALSAGEASSPGRRVLGSQHAGLQFRDGDHADQHLIGQSFRLQPASQLLGDETDVSSKPLAALAVTAKASPRPSRRSAHPDRLEDQSLPDDAKGAT